MNKKYILILFLMLVTIGIVGRFLPHLWNATPIIAIALFAGVYLGARYAIVVPLVVMIVTDFFIGFYQFEVMLAVYGSFALVGLIGYLIRKIKSAPVVVLSSMVSSILFYLVTNWAVWQFSPLYQKTLAGLLSSYTVAIPFFRHMFFGDLVYTVALFGAYELVMSKKVSAYALLAPRLGFHTFLKINNNVLNFQKVGDAHSTSPINLNKKIRAYALLAPRFGNNKLLTSYFTHSTSPIIKKYNN